MRPTRSTKALLYLLTPHQHKLRHLHEHAYALISFGGRAPCELAGRQCASRYSPSHVVRHTGIIG